jgi:hypothetical protein
MTNLEIALTILLTVAAIIIAVQKLTINGLTQELIASDDATENLESAHEALVKSNYLMSLSGNLNMQGQVHQNRKVIATIENDVANEL